VSDKRVLTFRRLSTGSVFRMVAIGCFWSMVPFAVLMGVFALFGFHTVTWNHEPVIGISGLLASPFIGLFVAAIFTIFTGVFLSVGLWLYSKFRPVTISIFEDIASGA
jgi:hypothetical protein